MRRFRASAVVVGGSQQRLLWRKLRERGRVFEAALCCCLADEIFFVNDGDQGSPSCVKQECSRVIYFLGKLGRWRLPYDVMVPWESSFICCFPPPKEKPTRAGAVGEPPGTKTITKTKRREI